MKNLIIFLSIFLISCNANKKIQLNETETNMISKLTEIKSEEKFIEGSNGWDGYTGCKNPDEKNAYSKNINDLINILIQSIKDKKDKSSQEKIIDEYLLNIENLTEKYKADTDESEMNYMYFERIRQILEI
jgi:hypothetical protein